MAYPCGSPTSRRPSTSPPARSSPTSRSSAWPAATCASVVRPDAPRRRHLRLVGRRRRPPRPVAAAPARHADVAYGRLHSGAQDRAARRRARRRAEHRRRRAADRDGGRHLRLRLRHRVAVRPAAADRVDDQHLAEPAALQPDVVKLAADGTACLQLYTSNNTSLDLVVDAVGWTNGTVTAPPPPTPTPPTTADTAALRALRHVAGRRHVADRRAVRRRGAPRRGDPRRQRRVQRDARLDPANRWSARVTGNFTGTTDQIIQWAACKWGIDEDIVRAQAAKESGWHQNAAGDWRTDGNCSRTHRRNGSSCADSSGSCRSASPPRVRRSRRR